MADDNKTGEKPAAGDTQIDYKAELEKLKSENESLKKKTEDLTLDLMSEDYLNFLTSKGESSKSTSQTETKTVTVNDDEFSKMTPKQIYDKALADAKAAAKAEVDAHKSAQKQEADIRAKEEVKKFASTHSDFEQYRKIMLGLSNEHPNFTLQELYDESKKLVKSLATGATEEEKERSKKSQGEKPGFSTSSFKRGDKKLSADEAAEEAWNAVVGKDGLPPAV